MGRRRCRPLPDQREDPADEGEDRADVKASAADEADDRADQGG